ncbi:MAG: PEGA domain-containing protein [Myxococcales bacterium]|nr:PEGA domain-containing protein [Myxococcales bacterium]
MSVALKAAGGAVETHQSAESLGRGELQVALIAIHLVPELGNLLGELLPRLVGDARVIVILPRSTLGPVVEVLGASERIAAVMIAEAFDVSDLSALATRILGGDLFGLEKMVPWGTKIHSTLVGDYQEKSLCIAQISEFAEMMGVRRKYRESIEQSVDEMLMNALYDAPVDEQGRPIFSEIPTKTRISLRVEQKVVVQYTCDGKAFAVSVRDAFGTLERSTILRYLHKCLHAEQQIDRKTGGAGLGLYLIANNSSQILFNVLPGVATEVLTRFDLDAPKLQLETLGFFNEKIDASGRLVGGPSRRLPAGASYPVERRAPEVASRGLVAALGVAIATMLALIAVVAWPRLFGASKTSVEIQTDPPGVAVFVEGKNVGVAVSGKLTVEGLEVGRTYPVEGRLEGYEAATSAVRVADKNNVFSFKLRPIAASVTLESDPPGATIVVDGKELGKTPKVVTDFPPSSTVSVVFKKDGYSPTTALVSVPGPGKETKIVHQLTVASDLASVVLISDPPGADVYHNGQLLAGVKTPTDAILVKGGTEQRFVLHLAGRVPALVRVNPSPGAQRMEQSATLAEGVQLKVEANLDGKVSVEGSLMCKQIDSPATCTLEPGDYNVSFASGGSKATRRVQVKSKETKVSFGFGWVVPGKNKVLQTDAGPASKLTFEEGKQTVIVSNSDGSNIHGVKVMIRAGVTTTAE